MNTHKSELLNISLPQTLANTLRSSFPFKLQPHHIKYLGILIPSNPSQLFTYNYAPLLRSLESDLKTWSTKSFCWFGRMAIMKMDILPRVLYFFQTLPISLPKCFFGKLTSLMIKFVWNNKSPRLKTAILTRKKEEGGVSIPDFQLYHFAALSTCILDLFHGLQSKRWVSLEYQISSLPPSSILWMDPEHRPKLTHRSFLMSSLLPFSDRHWNQLGLSSRPGPLTPVFGNPDFSANLHNPMLCSQVRSPKITICHFLVVDQLLPLSHFLTDIPSSRDWLQYQQLSSFYNRLNAKHRVRAKLFPFEKMCLQESPPTKTLSFVYSMLCEERTKQFPPPYQNKWESDLGHPISSEDWRIIFALTHRSSISGYTQEKNFKVLSRWYKTPDILHKIYPSVPDICWRCNNAPGSYFHIWWACPEVSSFWQSVFTFI